jgi:hypothetical protein
VSIGEGLLALPFATPPLVVGEPLLPFGEEGEPVFPPGFFLSVLEGATDAFLLARAAAIEGLGFSSPDELAFIRSILSSWFFFCEESAPNLFFSFS